MQGKRSVKRGSEPKMIEHRIHLKADKWWTIVFFTIFLQPIECLVLLSHVPT